MKPASTVRNHTFPPPESGSNNTILNSCSPDPFGSLDPEEVILAIAHTKNAEEVEARRREAEAEKSKSRRKAYEEKKKALKEEGRADQQLLTGYEEKKKALREELDQQLLTEQGKYGGKEQGAMISETRHP